MRAMRARDRRLVLAASVLSMCASRHVACRRLHDSAAVPSWQLQQPHCLSQHCGSCGRQRRRLEAHGGRIGDVAPWPKSAVREAFFVETMV